MTDQEMVGAMRHHVQKALEAAPEAEREAMMQHLAERLDGWGTYDKDKVSPDHSNPEKFSQTVIQEAYPLIETLETENGPQENWDSAKVIATA
jgi:hypothetical protein